MTEVVEGKDQVESNFLCFDTIYQATRASYDAIEPEDSILALSVIIQSVICMEAFINEISSLFLPFLKIEDSSSLKDIVVFLFSPANPKL